MGVQKITFDGSSISSKIDADVYHFLLSSEVGIFKGFKSGIAYTISNNVINFSEGYVSIYGRLLYVENNTKVSITTDSKKYGLVVLGINTNDNTATIYIKETTSSYPNLSRTNLLDKNGLYELVLCAYTKTTSSVTLNTSYKRKTISNYKDQIEALKDEYRSTVLPIEITPTKISDGVYSISDVNSYILNRSIIHVVLSGTTIITIPGKQIFFVVGSNATVSYRHNASDYSLWLAYQSGVLKFSCGSTTHKINKVLMTTY